MSSNGVCYAPSGDVAQVQNGTNLTSTRIYNDRLQPCWMYSTTGTPLPASTACTSTAAAGNILDLKYNFNLAAGDNGTVVGVTNDRDNTRTQNFTYDQLNRILTAQTPNICSPNCWSQTFGYDPWTNLISVSATGSALPLSLTVNPNNQISSPGFTYDLAGNELTDVTSSYAWNAQSQMKTANGVNYSYDGDGDRVEKSNGKIYWYGQGGEILAESDLSGNFTADYAFFGGERVARYDYSTGNVFYYSEDSLGSSRIIVQAGQTGPCYDADFYPFGGEKAYTNTCPQNYKFEGKERDAETNNDDFGARYYSSAYGRWLSSDWSDDPSPVPYANLTNPQTLNLYAMVSDDPESFADLDGHGGCGSAGSGGSSTGAAGCISGLAQAPGAKNGVIPGKSRGLVGKLLWILFGDPKAPTRPAPDTNPVSGALTNNLIGLFNLGNRIFGNPQQIPYFAPKTPDQAAGMKVAGLGLMFVPGPDVDELLAQLTQGIKPIAEGPELQAVIDKLWQTGDTLPGGTGGAIRNEIETGLATKGRIHFTKGLNEARRIQKLLRGGGLSASDTSLGKAIILYLREMSTVK